MSKRLLHALALSFWLAAPASAQVTGPTYVFTDGTTIFAAEVNSNFSVVYNNALNRLGGTMLGNLLFSPDNTSDIGASGTTRPRDLFLARNAVIGGTLTTIGTSTFNGATVFGGASNTFNGAATFNASVTAGSTLAVTGTSTFNGSTTFGGSSNTFNGASTFNANVTLGAALTVTGISTFNGSTIFGGSSNTFNGASAFNASVTLTDGSVGAPGAAFVADPDTGLWRPGNNRVGFQTAGAARWEIDASGHLVPAADASFNLGSTAAGVNRLLMAEGSAGTPAIADGSNPDSGIHFTNDGLGGNGSFNVDIEGSTKLQIGTGITTITATLLVNGTAGFQSSVQVGSVTFAALPSPQNGMLIYCSDCTIANPCASGGSGAFAKRINSTWICN